MALKTDIDNAEVNASATKRAIQLALFAREVKIITQQIVDLISTGSIPAVVLVQKRNSLAQIRANVVAWPRGSLTSLAIRNELIALNLTTSTTAAGVQVEIASLNTALTRLLAEIEVVLVTARANGQIYNSDSVTGAEVIMSLSTPDTDGVLGLAQSVTTSIN